MTHPNVKFSHKNEEFEIRIDETRDPVTVRAFKVKSNKAANVYVYEARQEIIDDGNNAGQDLVQVLIDQAKHDVENETWEKFLKAKQSVGM